MQQCINIYQYIRLQFGKTNTLLHLIKKTPKKYKLLKLILTLPKARKPQSHSPKDVVKSKCV